MRPVIGVKRLLWFLSLVILTLGSVQTLHAQQCIMSQSNAPSFEALEQVDHGAAAGADLNEYAILLHDIRIEACNTPRLRKAFENKLRNQLTHPSGGFGGFSGFLSGGITSFAYATGVILGGKNQLTPEIDKLLGDMPWQVDLKGDCGFTGFAHGVPRWTRGDNCMDDFSVAAEGFAWRAAYFSKTKRTARANADRADAVAFINRTILDTDESICIYDQSGDTSGPKGPCNATISALRQSMNNGGNVAVIPLNHTQENANYGIGLISTVANAFLGLEAMGQPMGSKTGDYTNRADFETVMEGLFRQGQRTAGADPNHPDLCIAWASQCYRPVPTPLPGETAECTRHTVPFLTGDDFQPANRNRQCLDRDNDKYRISIYPVAPFYDAYGFNKGAPPPAFQFTGATFPDQYFRPGGVFTNPMELGGSLVFGIGRFEIYYTLGYEWWDFPERRPNFNFTFDPALCDKPDATIIAPRQVQAKETITVRVKPQPPGTTVSWEVYNIDTEAGFLQGVTGESVTVTAGCTATKFPPAEHLVFFATVTSNCGETSEKQPFIIPVQQPTALVGNGGTITQGQSIEIPVYLTGVGPWTLKWKDGLEQVVHRVNTSHPYVFMRHVNANLLPEGTHKFELESVIGASCTGSTFGSAIVTVLPANDKATPIIIIEDTIASAGVQATFKARLSVVQGGYIPGAELVFSALGKVLGSAVTDENGRASVKGVIDAAPGSYPGGVKVSFAGNDAIKPGIGSGSLSIICASSITVAPNTLDVGGAQADYEFVVTSSQYCPWKPEAAPGSEWITVLTPTEPKTGSGTFTLRVAALPAGAASRRGFFFVGSKTYQIDQSAECSYRFNPLVAFLQADNDAGSIATMDVITQGGCPWTVTTEDSWITLLNASNVAVDELTGTGSATVKFRVATNSDDARTGRLRLSVNGSERATGSVNQYAPPPCTPVELVTDLRGGTVRHGSNVAMYPVFAGTNIRYTMWIDGNPTNSQFFQPSIIFPSWSDRYPSPAQSVRVRVFARNDCGGANTEEVTWTNETPPGETCMVPVFSNHPNSHSSPRPGANVTLSVSATGPRGEFEDESFKYQWYHGISGDRSSPVFNGNKKTITVSPSQNSYYWAEVDDLDDACGTNISGTGVVLITPVSRPRVVSHDFTGDGRSDLVWHNGSTKQNELWAMNGTTKGNTIALPQNDPGSKIQSIGDLNGDERPDLLWRNPVTGANSVWTMNGTHLADIDPLPSRPGGSWTIGGVADFDDDQNQDIVWHNDATGENEIWFQEGTNRNGTFALPPTPDANWGLHGSQDFTRDGKPDLFFYNRSTGQTSIWVMNDSEPFSMVGQSTATDRANDGELRRTPKRQPRVAAVQALANVQDTDFVPASVADFNGDGQPDIVWRNKITGDNSVWIMSATTVLRTETVTPQPDTSWEVGGGGSSNGTGGQGGGDTGTATSLIVSAEPAPFNGGSIVTATLTSNGSPVAGRTVVFLLNGSEKSRLKTDAAGSALAGLSVAGLAAGTHANAISVRFDGDTQYAGSNASTDLVITGRQPVVTWATPAPIAYGTPLGAAQLNATADVAGSFVYTPAAGAILDAGYNALDVTFTPADTTLSSVSRTVILLVNPASASLTWPAPAPIAHGTPLGAAQLNATTTVPGSFTYNPPAGTVLGVGTHTLQATFEPQGASNYIVPPATNTIQVIQGTQTISWSSPAPIVYGQALTPIQLNASVTTSGTAPAGALTYNPPAGTILSAGTHTLTVTAAPTPFYAGASKSVQVVVNRVTPIVHWSDPAPIVHGTPLSAAQLNAAATVPGTFTYTPAAGTILNAGTQTLSVQFTPNDSTNYNSASRSVSITVLKAKPVLTWSAPAAITYGTSLSAAQLNATASVPGTFSYTPASGAILDAGTHTLSVQFTPADANNYESASASTTLVVNRTKQTITWAAPSPIVYGTPLSSTQLNASVSVVGPSPAGALTYTPAAGTILQAGAAQVLTVNVAATPNYDAATASVTIDVLRAKPVIVWAQPAPIVYGTLLGAAQLNATANVPGSFVYTPPAGTLLQAGLETLSAHFTPADTHNYEHADASVSLEIQRATPVITWAAPAGIVYGTALDATQLNATANVAGTFAYTPQSGTILNAGNAQTLSAHFTPGDTRNYNDATASVTIDVAKAAHTLSWTPPAPIVYGTKLSAAQLNASVSVVGPAAAGALVYAPPAGTAFDAGTHTLTVTAQETENYLSATLAVSIDVTRAPLSLVADPKSKLYGAAVPPLTGTLTGVVNGDAITPSYATTATQQSVVGTYPITATLIDPNNRLVNYNVTITPSTLDVVPAPLLIAANPAAKQYSDPLPQLGATFTGLVLGETPAVLHGTLVLTTTATPLSAPGAYPISIGGLTSPNYAIAYAGSTLTVTAEDARVAITSPLLVSAAPGAPARVTLTAAIRDISATADASGDDAPGDIRNATLQFIDRATNAVLCTAPIGLADPADARIGVATCTFTRTFTTPASLIVGARIGAYYTRDAAADDVTMTIAAPTADSITGGGSTATGKVNVNLKYDRNGVARGNYTFTFQRDGRTFEVSATSIDSLAIVRAATGGTAALVGTATLRDITTPTAPVTIDAAAPLIIHATDDGEPSSRDAMSVLLLKKDGGFWLTTAWNGTTSTPQPLLTGNLQIHHAK